MTAKSADQDTITRRIIALNDQLDRQLDALLKKLGVSKEQLAAIAANLPKDHRTETLAKIESSLPPSTIDWDKLKRPAASDLSRSGLRLMRA
jgi:hypothetical protein